MNDEIKVGGIVYSPDFGKGRVIELHKLLGYDVADVGFAGHEHPKTINIVNLSTMNPNVEIQRLTDELYEMTRAHNENVREIQSLTQRVRELEDKLRPFALAAKDKDVQALPDDHYLRVYSPHSFGIEMHISIAYGTKLLSVSHLRDAARVLPDATTATGDSE